MSISYFCCQRIHHKYKHEGAKTLLPLLCLSTVYFFPSNANTRFGSLSFAFFQVSKNTVDPSVSPFCISDNKDYIYCSSSFHNTKFHVISYYFWLYIITILFFSIPLVSFPLPILCLIVLTPCTSLWHPMPCHLCYCLSCFSAHYPWVLLMSLYILR